MKGISCNEMCARVIKTTYTRMRAETTHTHTHTQTSRTNVSETQTEAAKFSSLIDMSVEGDFKLTPILPRHITKLEEALAAKRTAIAQQIKRGRKRGRKTPTQQP